MIGIRAAYLTKCQEVVAVKDCGEIMGRNRRRHLRVSSLTEVWVGHKGIFSRKDERLVTLSAGGAFIRTRRQYQTGQCLALRFRLSPGDDFITCQAIVRNYVAGRGVGVEFTDLARDDFARIRGFVETQLLAEAIQKILQCDTTDPPQDTQPWCAEPWIVQPC